MSDESAPHSDLPPISREDFRDLLDYLDRPDPPPCTHTFKETIDFLQNRGLQVEKMLPWLQENGAYCDCEVIYNTDNDWGKWAGRYPSDS